MYIDSWDSFLQQAEALYRANPLKTRYVTKYRHCDGKLVLKVTDDTVVSPWLRPCGVLEAAARWQPPPPPHHRCRQCRSRTLSRRPGPRFAGAAVQDRPASGPEED